jgi:2-methylcitrate dehydratase PrpD
VNGNMGHALDFDDTFPIAVHYNMHPSAAVIPAVLSLAEKNGLSGRKALAAYVVGMEVTYRVGAAMSAFIPQSGWHPTPVIGTLGAAAACANLLDLGPMQVRNALGIAASLAGGLLKNFGSMTKPLHAGNAVRNGVIAAELASLGFTANGAVFDGWNGFAQMFGDKKISGLMGAETDLGRQWKLVSIGLGFKPYPSCRSTHTSIDATMHLRNEFHITAGQVAEIICKISPIHTQMARFHKPESGYQGKFSIPYCVATALSKGTVCLADFTDDKVKASEAQKLLSRVRFLHPDEADQKGMDLAAEITIRLTDGSQYSYRVSLPKGEPENPMTDEELTAKFEACSRLILDKKDANKILNIIRNLEEEKDLTGLFKVLRKN